MLAALMAAAPASAHGGATGPQDILQDYGVLVFLLAIFVLGAGVLAWVTLSPAPHPEQPEPAQGAPSEPGRQPAARTGGR